MVYSKVKCKGLFMTTSHTNQCSPTKLVEL